MREISSNKSEEWQKDQFHVFCDLVSKLNKEKQKAFL